MVMIPYRWLLLLLICLTVVSPIPTDANTPPFEAAAIDMVVPPPEGAYKLPAVFVQNTQLTHVAANSIQGTFELHNQDTSTVGGLTYQIYLIDPAPALPPNTIAAETFFVYDHTVAPEKFSLAAGETKHVSFSYTPPAVPTGTYRLRLRAITSQGQELGWEDAAVQIGSATGFLTVSQGYVYAQGGSLIDASLNVDGGADPLAGVNVPPGNAIRFAYRLKNIGAAAITATPTLKTYAWDQTGPLIATATDQAITLAAGEESKELFFTATAATPPTAYAVTLTLVDSAGSKVSTVAEYRYVTTGVSGRILNAHFSEITPDRVVATITVVGPADRAHEVTGIVSATLVHDGQPAGTQQSEPVALGAENTATVTFAFAPPPPAGQQLGLRAVLNTTDGTLLDTYEFSVDTPPPPVQAPAADEGSRGWMVGGIIALLILTGSALAVAARLARRRAIPPLPPASTPLLIFLGLGMLALGTSGQLAHFAHGQGQSTYYFPPHAVTGANLTVFVNKPINNGPPINPAAVPFSADIRWAHCNNRWTIGRLYLDYFATGGLFVPSAQEWLPEADTPRGWRGQLSKIKDQLPPTLLPASRWKLLADSGSAFECRYNCPGGYDSIQSRTFAGTLSFDPTLPNTTIRYLAMQLHRPEPENVYFYKHLYGTYAHLNFISTPTPTPSVTPPPSPSVTPTLPPSVTPTPSPGSVPQCRDGQDNDGDTTIDQNDPGCRTIPSDPATYDPNDNDEVNPVLSPGPIRETE